MESIVILICLLILMCVIWFISVWLSHININKSCNRYGWSTFKIFKREFDNIKWDAPTNKHCLYAYEFGKNSSYSEGSSYYGYGEIKFNGVGMIMKTPIAYLRAILYAKKYIKTHYLNLRKYKWK